MSDNKVGCWIKDLPYVWAAGNRYYLPVNSTQVVYILYNKVVPIDYNTALQMGTDMYFFYFNKDLNCDKVLNYFRVYNLLDTPTDLRINGQQIPVSNYLQKVDDHYIPTRQTPDSTDYEILQPNGKQFTLHTLTANMLDPTWKGPTPEILQDFTTYYREDVRLGVIPADNYTEYLFTVSKEYPTGIGTLQLANLYGSKYKQELDKVLSRFLRKKRINYRDVRIDWRGSDREIYAALNRIVPSEKATVWGSNVNDIHGITGRAKSRINDYKQYLPRSGKDIRLLDIGAGNCEIAVGFGNYLGIPKEKLWLVDIDYYCTTEMKKRASFLQVPPGGQIQLPSDSFDIILLQQVMHHMQDLMIKLREVYRLLKPGGVVLLREHNARNVYISDLIDVEHLLYDLVGQPNDYNQVVDSYAGTVYRSAEEWDRLLKSIGFKPVWIGTTSGPTVYYNAVYKK